MNGMTLFAGPNIPPPVEVVGLYCFVCFVCILVGMFILMKLFERLGTRHTVGHFCMIGKVNQSCMDAANATSVRLPRNPYL
jgi:hypothetical protein